MKVLFVDNLLFHGDPERPSFDLQPHLGLLSLVAVARQAGHEAHVFDPKLAVARGDLPWGEALYAAASARILAQAPDVVGFTALGCNFHCVVQIARAIRRARSSLPVLLGGPHASILHREILERLDGFTAVVRHEAEDTLVPVLDALGTARMGEIPGVSWRDPEGKVICNPGAPKVEDLDDLPVPAFDDYPMDDVDMAFVRIEAGRGCPFSCTFCSTASFFGRSYRLKSAPRLVAEMDLLASRHGFRDFKLNHDLFTVSRRKVLAFCEAVSPRGYRWACSARMDCVDAELLGAMAAAGCDNIYFGVETGSAVIQDTSRKRLDLSLVETTLAVTAKLGIETTTSFIIGYPDESAADRAATLDMAGRLHRLAGNTSQIHLLTPEPGTTMLEQHRGKLRFDARRCGFNLPRFASGDDGLIAADPDLFVTHYYYEGRVPHSRNVFDAAAWTELSMLGPDGYAFLLDRWGGSLARLLDEAYGWWAGARGAAATPRPDDLTRFAETVFGRRAPIVSRLRYRDACRGSSGADRAEPEAAGGATGLRLSPRAALLRDVHRSVVADGSLPAADVDLASFVILRSKDGDPVRAYEIDDITADLLSVIGGPGADQVLAYVDEADLTQLCVLEIVERAAVRAPAA